jgi:hypothetical protein
LAGGLVAAGLLLVLSGDKSLGLPMASSDEPSISIATPSSWGLSVSPSVGSGSSSHQVSVTTDNPAGYDLSAKLGGDEDCLQTAADVLANEMCNNIAAGRKIDMLSVDNSTSLGVNTWGVSLNNGTNWRVVPKDSAAAGLNIKTTSSAAVDDDTTVDLGAAVDYNLAADSYQNTLVFTAVANSSLVPAPTIASVDPTSGSVNGGTVVTVKGSGFMMNGSVVVYEVKIGGENCLAVDVVNNTTLECTTPASDAGVGLADVLVRTWGGEATLADGYEYVLPGPTTPPIITMSGNPCAGTLTDNTVTISYPEGTGYYRLNEDASWLVYTGPFVVTENTWVYAKAVDGAAESEVTEFIALVVERANEKFICNETDLRAVNSNPSWTYYMVNDISLASVWTPIATFSGKFYGRDKTINNMNFTATSANRGFISTVSTAGALIEHLIFTNVSIAGNIAAKGVVVGTVNAANFSLRYIDVPSGSISGNTNTNNVGGLVGSATVTANGSLTISDCHVGINLVGQQYVGGLIGYLSRAANSNTNISNSSYNGEITATSTLAGGLIGGNAATGVLTIENSTADVKITGTGTIGGLTGNNTGVASIINSSANVDITATAAAAGGLVGLNAGALEITDSYTTGLIGTSSTYSGGLIGNSTASLVVDGSYSEVGITATGNYAGGLLGGITASVMNSSFTDCYAVGDVTGTQYVGGLAGAFNVTAGNGAAITRSFARGNVTANTYIGGLVGQTSAALSQVYASGDITSKYTSATATATAHVGGLAGYLGAGSVSDAYALGDVSLASPNAGRSGGLVGYAAASAVITKAYSVGSVTFAETRELISAVVGVAEASATLSNLYWNAETSMIADPAADTKATILYWAASPASDYVGFDFGGVWANVDGVTVPYFQNVVIDDKNYISSIMRYDFDGAGSSQSDPYQIKNETDLAHVYLVPYAHYKVMNDFAVTENIATIPELLAGGIDGAGHTISGFQNNSTGLINTITNGDVYIKDLTFDNAAVTSAVTYSAVVIGTLNTSSNFTLDGVNVTNSAMNSTVNYAGGLIGGITAATGTVTIQNCQVSGAITGAYYVGAVAGIISGAAPVTIDNCSYSGDLSGTRYVGGLVGATSAATAGKLTIAESYTTGSVSPGASTYAGGLVGRVMGGVDLRDSFSASDIINTGNYSGGVAGEITTNASNTITRVYASGNINSGASSTYTGGLIGNAVNVTTTNVYALGDVVSGATSAGGLIGYLNGGSVTNAYAAGQTSHATIGSVANTPIITNLYWQVDTSHQQSATYGQPIRTLYEPSSKYVGFDFGSVWEMTQGSTIPYLRGVAIDDKNYIATIRKYNFAGEGLAGAPYLVSNFADFDQIRNNQHAYYKLTADIDLTGLAQLPDIWYGGIDGNGHTVRNFSLPTITTTGGLFATLTHPNVAIKNITLKDFSLVGTATNRGLIANTITATGVVLDGVNVENGTLISSTAAYQNYHGGLVAQVTATGGVTIRNCDVDLTLTGASYVAGLVSSVLAGGGVAIENCHVTGSITATTSTSYAGGLMGRVLSEFTISDSSFAGSFSAAASAGGLVGVGGVAASASSISDSVVSVNLTSTSNYVGGLIGNATNLDISGSAVTFTNSAPVAGAQYTGGLAGGIATRGSITNSSASGLGLNVSSNYAGGLVGNMATGDIVNSHSYLGDIISSGDDYIGGLVGYIGENSSISQSTAVTNVSGANYIGGLIGHLNGTDVSPNSVSDSFATGNVTASKAYVGGLVGYSQISSIADSYATGDVVAGSGSTHIGGLIGYATGGPISRVFARGDVSNISLSTTQGAFRMGGLIGLNGVAVSESYASGNVLFGGATSGNTFHIGGLVGENTASASLTNVYALGDVTGSTTGMNLGGLVGTLSSGSQITNAYSAGEIRSNDRPAANRAVFGTMSGTATNIYWVVMPSGVFTDPYATPIYLPIQPAADYVGFDFTNVWDNQDGVTVPYFRNVVIDDKNYISNMNIHHYDGLGTLADPYLIKAGADVDNIRTNPFANYKVANDFDMTSYGAIAPIPTGFVGTLDGDNRTITGLTVAATAAGAGLFSSIADDTVVIKDLTLNDINYTGNYINFGGLIGNLSVADFTLNNVNVTSGQIASTGTGVGGLVGNYTAENGKLTISNCLISTNFGSGSYLGGVVGRAAVTSEIVINNCTFSGTMSGSNNYRGGMVGSAGKVTMTNVSTIGTVVGSGYTGGIAGNIQGGSIVNAIVSGPDLAVSGSYNGGLVGQSSVADLNISDVVVSKNITGTGSYVGGLVGRAAGGTSITGTIDRAIMTGDIAGASYVGGLVGYSNVDIALHITTSYMSGDITTNNYRTGGLVGYTNNDTLENVFSLANISNATNTYTGGLIGQSVATTVTNAYATGKIGSTATYRQATIGSQTGVSNFTNIYWNVESSNIFEDAIGQPIATLYTPASEYVGFDFVDVWGMIQDPSTPEYTLPYLQDLPMPDRANITAWVDYTYGGQGLIGNPYQITNTTELNDVRNNPYAYYKVMNNLTLTGNWTPIPKIYAGGIDGQNYTLNGLAVASTAVNGGFIADSAGDYTVRNWQISGMSLTGNHAQKGFIGTATAGTLTVDKVGFVGGSISPATAQTNVGALLGLGNGADLNISNVTSSLDAVGAVNTGGLIGGISGANDVAISNVNVTGVITGASYVGGIIGNSSATLTIDGGTMASSITGTTTTTYLGGIVGSSTGATTLKNLVIDGQGGAKVITSLRYTGGAVGYATGDLALDNVHSSMNVNATSYDVGGLVGYSTTNSFSIKNSSNFGNVTSTNVRVGGLVGLMLGGSITDNSYSTGAVSGTTEVGGLVGSTTTNATTLSNVYATGDVTSTGTSGGLVGSITAASTIEQSYATGDVTSTGTNNGGLVGSFSVATSTVTSSYATGNVKGTTTLGGLIGQNYATLSKVYASGNVESTIAANGAVYAGGLVGHQYTSPVQDAFALGDITARVNAGNTYIGGLVGSSDGAFANIYYGGFLNGTIGSPASRQILAGTGLPVGTTGAYWYSDKSGYTGTTDYATSVTQASSAADFIGFDFTNVWDIDTSGNGSMPYLRGLTIDNKVYF